MFKLKVFITIISVLLSGFLKAQLQMETKSMFGLEAFVAGGDQAPFWFMANQGGRWNPIDKNQLISYGAVTLNSNAGKTWRFRAGLELDYSSGDDLVYLHTGFVRADWKALSLSVGRHRFSPIFNSNYSGSGSYLFGDNFRPVDRITFGIPAYTKLPILKGRLEVKGEVSHGRLDDGGGFYNHKSVLLHEKYAYLRYDGNRWKPYAGLNHSVLMGGYRSNGEKIPIDYWPSVFGQKSQKIGSGDATNAGGGHMGLYDFGLFVETRKARMQFFYQLPFTDTSGLLFWKRNKDQMAGVNIEFKDNRWIRNLTVEWFNTSYQSGNGTPDAYAVFTDGTWKLLPNSVIRASDLDQLMANMGQTRDTPYTYDEVVDYLRNTFNNGHEFGGRDAYMINGTYPANWTHFGMIMGNPLNLTRSQVAVNNPVLGSYTGNYVVNERLKAIHIGGNGTITENLQWFMKLTYSLNFGSYFNQYPGRYTWNETVDYYFKGGLNQAYTLAGLNWNPCKLHQLSFNASLSADCGEMYKSFGIKLGSRWCF